MYDRLPLDMVDTVADEEICKGHCLIFGPTGDQVTGLLLRETANSYLIGFPSKCFYGEDEESGEGVHTIVPFTSLPYLPISKESCSLVLPIHSDLEEHFYEYIVNVIATDEDYNTLLERFGFCPDKSLKYYSDRHLKVKEYNDTISGEVAVNYDEDDSRGETIH